MPQAPNWWQAIASHYGFFETSQVGLGADALIDLLRTNIADNGASYRNKIVTASGFGFSASDSPDLVLRLTPRPDFVAGGAGGDYISGLDGDDVLFGDSGSDLVRGGGGFDFIGLSALTDMRSVFDAVSYSDAPRGITLQFQSGFGYTLDDGYGSADVIFGANSVIGTDYSDSITVAGGIRYRIVGGNGDDTIRVDNAAATIFTGNGDDVVHLGIGAARLVIDGLGRDTVYGFGSNDILDFAGYLDRAPNMGALKIQASGSDTNIVHGDKVLVTLAGVAPAQINAATQIDISQPEILYVPILGQSNARGLGTSGADGQSGMSHIKSQLLSLTDYADVVLTARDIESKKLLEVAVGGTTVDGDLNRTYHASRVWWYPDQDKPGEVLIRAVDMLALQMADLRQKGVIKPAFIWGQGESEAYWVGAATNPEAAQVRYKEATLAIFDYIKERLGEDIQFYVMQTGRYQADGARNDGISETLIQAALRGVTLVRDAQEDMALARDDVHLAANYEDLRMLHDTDPIRFPTDNWHLDYDDREIIGDRLGQYIAADLGHTHVLSAFGPISNAFLNDLAYHDASGSDLQGTAGADLLIGTRADDVMRGQAGNDIYFIRAVGGHDVIEDTSGNLDSIRLFGVAANALTYTKADSDLVIGTDAASHHTITIKDFANSSVQTLTLENGTVVDLSGLSFEEEKDDVFIATISFETFDGDDGADTVSYENDVSRVNVNLASGVGARGFAQGDTYTDIENITGGFGGDALFGSAFANALLGMAGNDYISGAAGDDLLNGGVGNDFVLGGLGRDTFVFDSFNGVDSLLDFSLAQGDRIDVSGLIEGDVGGQTAIRNFVSLERSGYDLLLSVDADGLGAAKQSVLIAKISAAANFTLQDVINQNLIDV